MPAARYRLCGNCADAAGQGLRKNVRVDMTGGTLYIDVERDGNGHVTDLFLTGPTNIVCKGEITDEALDPSLLSM